MKSDSTKRLYHYWMELRGTRPAPERRDIEPSAIKALLSDVFILEHETGADFRFRLAGSAMCSAYCRELKGRSFRQFWADKDLEALDTTLLAIREDAAAAVIGYEGINPRGQRAPFEMLLLPLRYGGHDYPRILGLALPCDSHYWLGVQPVMSHEITSMRLIWPDEQPSFMRHAVNAEMLVEPSFLHGVDEDETLLDARTGLAVVDTSMGDIRANARRQAFKVIDGGKS